MGHACHGHGRTIHDFGGFLRALCEVLYPAPGRKWLAQETVNAVQSVEVGLDQDWGLEHGAWSVLRQMFAAADLPVVQLSLDYTKPAQYHYDLGRELAPLRRKGVWILGGGNMVHNLGWVAPRGNSISDSNTPFGFGWALEATELFNKLINENDHRSLINYQALGSGARLAVPTPEHCLPLLYVRALKEQDESVAMSNEIPLTDSLTMTSLVIGEGE